MLDTIKVNTDKAQIIKPINVQDVYGTVYTVPAFSYPQMGLREKRFIQGAKFIEETGKYYPSVTFRSNGIIFIEFSAPKILFDNNVEELTDSNAKEFAKALSLKLYDMGINLSIDDGWKSSVSFSTVSKNIVIEDVGATEFIEFTRRLWWKWRHTTKIENYEHNGIAIREFTSTTGIGIYAKVPSLDGISTPTNRELELSEKLNDNNILRFEYRMQNYQRMKSKYSWVAGYDMVNVTLKDVFKSDWSKEILLYDLNKSIFSNEFKLISMQLPTIKKMYEFLMGQGLKPYEEWAVITYFRLCSDLGVDVARKVFEERYSQSTSKRVNKLCLNTFDSFKQSDYSGVRDKIRDDMVDFKPIGHEQIELLSSKFEIKEKQMKLL